jgi:hypothetical protein
MAKEVNKDNLCEYAKEHLHATANAVKAGLLNARTAKGHIRELFYLSATFDLGIQDEAHGLVIELTRRINEQ